MGQAFQGTDFSIGALVDAVRAGELQQQIRRLILEPFSAALRTCTTSIWS